MAQFRQDKIKKLGRLILRLILMLFAIAYLLSGIVCILLLVYILLSLSKYASLYFLAAFIAAVVLPGFVLTRTRRTKRSAGVKNLSKEDAVLRGLLLVTMVSLLVWAALQASLVAYVEAEYAAVRDSYRKLLLSYLKSRKEEGMLGAAWDVTLALKREYAGTYGQKYSYPVGSFRGPMFRHLPQCYRFTAGRAV